MEAIQIPQGDAHLDEDLGGGPLGLGSRHLLVDVDDAVPELRRERHSSRIAVELTEPIERFDVVTVENESASIELLGVRELSGRTENLRGERVQVRRLFEPGEVSNRGERLVVLASLREHVTEGSDEIGAIGVLIELLADRVFRRLVLTRAEKELDVVFLLESGVRGPPHPKHRHPKRRRPKRRRPKRRHRGDGDPDSPRGRHPRPRFGRDRLPCSTG